MRITPTLCTRAAIAIILVWVVTGGHYPPAAQGQRMPQQVQVVAVATAEDAGQDKELAAIERHLESTDSAVIKLTEKTDNNANTTSGIQGEERGIGLLLLLLQIVSMVQAARKVKA